jgi:hypothetical protein
MKLVFYDSVSFISCGSAKSNQGLLEYKCIMLTTLHFISRPIKHTHTYAHARTNLHMCLLRFPEQYCALGGTEMLHLILRVT